MTARQQSAIIVTVFAVLVAVGNFLLPYIEDYTETADFASTVAGNSDRFQWAMLLIVLGLGIGIAAMTVIHRRLLEAAAPRWTFWAIPLIATGTALILAQKGAIGFGIPAAVAGAGEAEAASAGDSLADWMPPMYIAGSLLFATGWIATAVAVVRTRIYDRRLSLLALAGIIAFAASFLIPTGVQAYVQGVGALLGFLPVAAALWLDRTRSSEAMLAPPHV